jgi:hypothetical protein
LSIEQQRSLVRLLACAHPDDAREGIRDSYQERNVNLSPREVVVTVANAFEMTYEELTGPSRSKRHMKPRMIAADILRSPWFGLGLEAIAEAMDRQDHTTIRYYLQNSTRDELFWEVAYEVAERAGISHDSARKRIAPKGD